jgi:hypothetical protein
MAETALLPRSIEACTLADGDYLIGAGALANSLYAGGYRGVFWIGCRGALPDWARGEVVQHGAWRSWRAAPDLEIRLVEIGGTRALSGEKPAFMLRLLDQLAPQLDGLLFFDADIVVHAPWHHLARWVECGVALCCEAQPLVPDGHPNRHYWRQMIGQIGRAARPLDYYVNSGFVGILRRDRDLLDAWAQLMAQCEQHMGRQIEGIRHSTDLLHPLWATDQHMLNAAMMASTVKLSIVGPEGMDFFPLGIWMSHALNRDKPWRASYLKQALLGFSPLLAQRVFWLHVKQPIKVLSPGRVALSKAALKFNALVSRFYRKA